MRQAWRCRRKKQPISFHVLGGEAFGVLRQIMNRHDGVVVRLCFFAANNKDVDLELLTQLTMQALRKSAKMRNAVRSGQCPSCQTRHSFAPRGLLRMLACRG